AAGVALALIQLHLATGFFLRRRDRVDDALLVRAELEHQGDVRGRTRRATPQQQTSRQPPRSRACLRHPWSPFSLTRTQRAREGERTLRLRFRLVSFAA